MSDSENTPAPDARPRKIHPFRRAILRGLAVAMPPLLTIIVFLWAWSLINGYVLEPIERGARMIIVAATWRTLESPPDPQVRSRYANLPNGQWIPVEIYETVNIRPGEHRPESAIGYYNRYVDLRYLPRYRTIPLFLAAFVLVLYLLGKFLAAGVGHWAWRTSESIIIRLPIVRKVYSAVKQVTDLFFAEQEVQFNRIVAFEYPRKGIWSIGFVTGEGMSAVAAISGEPMLTVLTPTSPMPATGFVLTVKKSDVIDLNISIDEAIQFVVSCGVVVPNTKLVYKPRPGTGSGIGIGSDSSAGKAKETAIAPHDRLSEA